MVFCFYKRLENGQKQSRGVSAVHVIRRSIIVDVVYMYICARGQKKLTSDRCAMTNL